MQKKKMSSLWKRRTIYIQSSVLSYAHMHFFIADMFNENYLSFYLSVAAQQEAQMNKIWL